MAKAILIKSVTELTEHESEMGRGGLIRFKVSTGNVTSSVTEIPVKTWDEEVISSEVAVSSLSPELVTYKKLLEVERSYHRKSFKLAVGEGHVYVDWSTMIKQAMGLYGPNSYQEAKAAWAGLSAKKRNTYSVNAETELIKLLGHKGDIEVRLFTKA